MQEQKIESYLKKQVELLGGKAYKFVSPGVTGVPDRIVVLPGGKIFFVELKAPGKKLRKIQEVRKAELEALGQRVEVIDSKEKVDELLKRKKVNSIEIHNMQ